ncbi:AraC family transcriptional regulator [Gracilibacillus alcaliphilus]|uniref:AraC family transcriptional regulator n=1 Tax=Gracilibacillus alcaliphilus TaxID=1401441 RepID=UPI001956F0B1|nr:AraC family transcriptional regulator [Gracilibacillus alcaliphilus]MBM7675581.1 AraC family transcriptional regulator [Gracilibacillus alcaliphilus]
MLKGMNQAMQYIEEHLDKEIEERELEKITGTSIYHFRRLFTFLSGMTLTAYIRNRRLSNAAFDLLREGVSVTDTAFKYGYDSVDGFSRAFREWAGFSPSEVKQQQRQRLRTFPKLTFQLTIQGGINMDYKIVEKEAFKVIGVSKRVPVQFEGVNPEIEQLAKSITDKQWEVMHRHANIEPKKVINASYNFDSDRMQEAGLLDHMIGMLTTEEDLFEDVDVLEVPSQTWAIFSSQGEFPKKLQETWAKIASEWLPASDYQLVEAPEISYIEDYTDLDNVYSEIWIAVKKRGTV